MHSVTDAKLVRLITIISKDIIIFQRHHYTFAQNPKYKYFNNIVK